MATKFSEEQVHTYIYQQGLEPLIDDVPEFGEGTGGAQANTEAGFEGEDNFELWRIIKAKALEKLKRLHRTIRYGTFVGSKIKLPIDNSRPMELDFLGQYENGIFILELKVDRSAERNAFSELLAYSNYVAEMFALSGHKDIANVLVANIDVKITQRAVLYDLLITDRNIIVYKPEFQGAGLDSLRLKLHIPSDDDFRFFTNELLSHDAMACVVASFGDIPGWIDNKESNGNLSKHTVNHLEKLSSYTAQLMEAEHLHGFCFIRKRWNEIPSSDQSSLVICALNTFRIAHPQRSDAITEQLAEEDRNGFLEFLALGFYERLVSIAQRAAKDTLTHDFRCAIETPMWSTMVTSMLEVVFTHNLGFHPTGMMREAYISHLNTIYARNESQGYGEDVSTLKVNEITNWLRAWQFMEGCGFVAEAE
jgi:hypothetical protein